MRTLKDHIILYDAACPMCKLYTAAFIKTKMLDAFGREPYQKIPKTICPFVDQQKAVNEIALVNKITGEVTYGIKSLFKILSNALPFLRPLFLFRPFIWFMEKIYSFISYNRRVIIPVSRSEDDFIFQPSFRKDYRILYLAFTWFTTGWILSVYSSLLKDVITPGNSYREYLICGGQILFQGLVASVAVKKNILEYLGNMMTISFAGSLLLMPALLITKVLIFSPVVYALYFIAVASLMLLEHIRRTKILGIGWIMTVSWVLYRVFVLMLILIN